MQFECSSLHKCYAITCATVYRKSFSFAYSVINALHFKWNEKKLCLRQRVEKKSHLNKYLIENAHKLCIAMLLHTYSTDYWNCGIFIYHLRSFHVENHVATFFFCPFAIFSFEIEINKSDYTWINCENDRNLHK